MDASAGTIDAKGGYWANGTQGATGTFEDNGGGTITVTGGLVTGIAAPKPTSQLMEMQNEINILKAENLELWTRLETLEAQVAKQ